MDKRTAKREACVLAATLIRGTVDTGWDLSDGHGYTDADVVKVGLALADLVEELERRGHK